jgi:hypothetical protein
LTGDQEQCRAHALFHDQVLSSVLLIHRVRRPLSYRIHSFALAAADR